MIDVKIGTSYLHRGLLVTVKARVGHHPTRGTLYAARIGTEGYVNVFADELEV